MYGATPDVVISKQPPRKFQPRVVVVALCGVLIGSLGTAMLFPVAVKETNAPTTPPTTPAPRILAAMEVPGFGACPAACASWYDGCNTCSCEDGEIGACTRRFCEIYEEPRCLDEP